MMPILIDLKIRERCPRLILNTLECQVSFSHENEQLWLYIEKSLNEVRKALKLDDISKIPAIQKAREAYKKLGKDPSRYSLSAEALLRRILQAKGLYRVNNVIDILNIISVKSGISIGGYDIDRIQGNVILSTADQKEEYYAVGRGLLNICNMPVLRDSIGSFGNPTSDSERTSVTDKTKRFLMVFFNFEGSGYANEWLNESKNLLIQYAKANEFTETLPV